MLSGVKIEGKELHKNSVFSCLCFTLQSIRPSDLIFYSFPLIYFRYFAVEGKTLKVKTKLSQRVGVQYYIEVHGINDRLSTRALAVWKYNITTCVKNVHAPYFKQVSTAQHTSY